MKLKQFYTGKKWQTAERREVWRNEAYFHNVYRLYKRRDCFSTIIRFSHSSTRSLKYWTSLIIRAVFVRYSFHVYHFFFTFFFPQINAIFRSFCISDYVKLCNHFKLSKFNLKLIIAGYSVMCMRVCCNWTCCLQ